MIAMVNAELRDQILVVIPFALFDRFFKRKAEQQKQQMKTSSKFDDEDYFGMLSWNPLGEITECFPIRREREPPPTPQVMVIHLVVAFTFQLCHASTKSRKAPWKCHIYIVMVAMMPRQSPLKLLPVFSKQVTQVWEWILF